MVDIIRKVLSLGFTGAMRSQRGLPREKSRIKIMWCAEKEPNRIGGTNRRYASPPSAERQGYGDRATHESKNNN
jgi:hypothetical protein